MERTKKLLFLSMIMWLGVQASVIADPAPVDSNQATKKTVSETYTQTSAQASNTTSAATANQTTKSTTVTTSVSPPPANKTEPKAENTPTTKPADKQPEKQGDKQADKPADKQVSNLPPDPHTLEMRLTGSSCASCLKELEKKLKGIPGVKTARVDLPEQTYHSYETPMSLQSSKAVIDYDAAQVSSQSLKDFLKQRGYFPFKAIDKSNTN